MVENKFPLAAVVILYHPGDNFIHNMGSYIDEVEKVYIIDNSTTSHEDLLNNCIHKDKLDYTFNNENLGIATALNIGCAIACRDGFKWALTMDQDSYFSGFDSREISESISFSDDKIALFYPNYIIDGKVYENYITENNRPVIVMTSGNILNLNIHIILGGFEEKLFIDYVDIDYCLKVKKWGFAIKQIPSLTLRHELGNSKRVSLFFKKAIVTNHSGLRRYYITRNRLYVVNKYRHVSKEFVKVEKKVFLNDLIKVLLYEDDKWGKIKSIIKGVLDYKQNKFGIYQE